MNVKIIIEETLALILIINNGHKNPLPHSYLKYCEHCWHKGVQINLAITVLSIPRLLTPKQIFENLNSRMSSSFIDMIELISIIGLEGTKMHRLYK